MKAREREEGGSGTFICDRFPIGEYARRRGTRENKNLRSQRVTSDKKERRGKRKQASYQDGEGILLLCFVVVEDEDGRVQLIALFKMDELAQKSYLVPDH